MAARNAAKKSTPRKAPGRREAKAAAPAAGGATTTVTTAPAPATTARSTAASGGFAARKDEFVKYLQAVRGEFNRVTWPGNTNSFTKSLRSPEMKAATLVVLFTLVMFSMYLGLMDQLLVRIFGWVGK